MPSTAERSNNATDDLFNYDAGLDDILGENPEPNTADQNNNSSSRTNQSNGNGTGGNSADLGLDDEIKVTRKRAPVAKLDENRLLSQNGIPKLRRTSKTKLRVKGKGHEFSDAARLLTFYQLWLDDLYPRAKFADALTMVEKLGHSKRMQVMRREWIDEGKPRFDGGITSADTDGPERREDAEDKDRQVGRRGDTGVDGVDVDPVDGSDKCPEARNGDDDGVGLSLFGDGRRMTPTHDDDDEEDRLFVSDPQTNDAEPEPNPAPTHETPEEDDLDALLGETEDTGVRTGPQRSADSTALRPPLPNDNNNNDHDDFEDDLEAMNMYGA